jgi:hypothetical protein
MSGVSIEHGVGDKGEKARYHSPVWLWMYGLKVTASSERFVITISIVEPQHLRHRRHGFGIRFGLTVWDEITSEPGRPRTGNVGARLELQIAQHHHRFAAPRLGIRFLFKCDRGWK